MSSLTLLALLTACDDPPRTDPPEPALIALTPTEYNNTVRDLLGMPMAASDWPAPPPIASSLTASQGEQSDVFGAVQVSPWPWALPEESGVDGFEGVFDGQEPSAYRLEELQKAAVHFAAYTLVSDTFFACDGWEDLDAEAQASCGLESIERFANRGWRRPLTDEESQRLQAYFQASWQAGTPQEAVVLTAAGVLQSPWFVFRVEEGDRASSQGKQIPLTDWEMASRLSYFLWDSMPDAALFEAAAKGELSTVEGVRSQVQRMLDDERAREAVTHFHHQWLETDQVLGISPARSAYADLYGVDPYPEDATDDGVWPSIMGPVRYSMQAELELFIQEIIFDGDGTLSALLTSPLGYLSSHTEPVYGEATPRDGESVTVTFENVSASIGYEDTLRLRPVTFSASERAGLMTQPAVLAVGAYAVHPAPILRGLRLLERLGCTEFGAPPASAESSAPPDTEEAEDTNRARTEAATSPAECTGCHSLMNPPGFAYEHYDAMGRWRAEDNGQPVDASGSFTLNGEAFSFTDGVDLAGTLAASDQIRGCYALRWTRYAVGQHLDEDDERAAALSERFQQNDDVKALLEDIATSEMFRCLSDGGEQ